MFVYVCVHISVCVCVGTSFSVPVLCVYLSLCVYVFLVRSSAGGDYGGAGEERRQHTGPHHLRRNRQGWETAGIKPAAWRTSSQVSATPVKKKRKNKYIHTFLLF